MDRFYVGLAQHGADGFPTQVEPIQQRHDRETAEMEARVDAAMTNLIAVSQRHGSSVDDIMQARHQLKEVIAESRALVLQHEFEWNR